MRRFYLEKTPDANGFLKVTGPEAHHLKNVLRLKKGSRVIFFDGQGTEYEAELVSLTGAEVSARIIARHAQEPERCLVTLGQGLLTGQKMELVIQKATELGLSAILPFTSKHCTVREPAGAKVERWHRIAREACKQCRRAREPEIGPVSSWRECLVAGKNHDLAVVFWENERDNTLATIGEAIAARQPASLLFLVGPEGGLAEEEIEEARQHDFLVIGLGRRILRAETASLAGAALVQYMAGNLE